MAPGRIAALILATLSTLWPPGSASAQDTDPCYCRFSGTCEDCPPPEMDAPCFGGRVCTPDDHYTCGWVVAPRGTPCNDGNLCTENDVCDGESLDGCRGERRDCADDLECTADVCERETGVCLHLPEDTCECPSEPIPTANVSKDWPFDGISVPCPSVLGGGSAGIESFSLGFSTRTQDAHCRNGCRQSASLEGRGRAAFGVCGKLKVQGEVFGGASTLRRSCVECNGSCEQYCAGGTCDVDRLGGGVRGSVSRFFGYELDPPEGPVRAEVKCGITVTARGELSGGTTETSDDGYRCGPCTECEETGVTATVGAGASADCHVKLSAFGASSSLGCTGCGAVSLDMGASITGREGECPGELCGSVFVRGSVSASFCAAASFRWWAGGHVSCSAGWRGCAETNTCGTCSQCAGCSGGGFFGSCAVGAGPC